MSLVVRQAAQHDAGPPADEIDSQAAKGQRLDSRNDDVTRLTRSTCSSEVKNGDFSGLMPTPPRDGRRFRAATDDVEMAKADRVEHGRVNGDNGTRF